MTGKEALDRYHAKQGIEDKGKFMTEVWDEYLEHRDDPDWERLGDEWRQLCRDFVTVKPRS